MQERKVILLEINDEKLFYGSMTAMFKDFSSKELGFSYSTLKNHLKTSGEYKNNKCKVTLGTIRTTKTNRGPKKNVDS